MVLCYGTFAKVLTLCKPSKRNPSNKELQTKLLSAVCDAYVSIPVSDDLSNGLLKCKHGLNAEIINNARSIVENGETDKIADYFEKRIINAKLIKNDSETAIRLVAALLDMIRNDMKKDAIEDSELIELVSGTRKKALLMQSEFVLPDFLAGLFLYVVLMGDNGRGKNYIESINENWISSYANSGITVSLTRFKKGIAPQLNNAGSIKEITAINLHDPTVFANYVKAVKHDHSTIKTLLYDNAPVPFYDFYVCNDILSHYGGFWSDVAERLIPRMKDEYQTALETIGFTKEKLNEPKRCPATFDIFRRLYKQAIFTGTGGIGKSMLMHHMVLTAVEVYDTLNIMPIFVPLKEYAESQTGLYGQILTAVTVHMAKEHLDFKLSQGECLLLLDGLDELKSEDKRKFKTELDALIRKYPENYYYISSRPDEQFISYDHFHRTELLPFTKEQALTLVGKLVFRPDEPKIKERFRNELDRRLFDTHKEFAENPLLLTIMLMTFEQYAEVPSKMHVFYREAFDALAKRHDANKGYSRTFRTGLTKDDFIKYFSDICFRSFRDQKLSFTEDEFKTYFKKLKTDINSDDFLYDISYNLCMLLHEGRAYHFVHRSFQEYFSAVYIKEAVGLNPSKLADFFDKRYDGSKSDNMLAMLYDMKPEFVEIFIIEPFLEKLFNRCDSAEDGKEYWAFLSEMYSAFYYTNGEVPAIKEFYDNEPNSKLYEFIKSKITISGKLNFLNLPHSQDFIEGTFYKVSTDGAGLLLIEEQDFYPNERGDGRTYVRDMLYDVTFPLIECFEPPAGYSFFVQVDELYDDRDKYSELLSALDNDEFVLKSEYNAMRQYLNEITQKHKETSEENDDLFS